MNLLLEGIRTFGPIFVEVVGALLSGEDPTEVFARKRVQEIVPDPLRSELALQARLAAAQLVSEHNAGEIARRTACRTCGSKGFVGVAPCPDCKGPAAALWGHED